MGPALSTLSHGLSSYSSHSQTFFLGCEGSEQFTNSWKPQAEANDLMDAIDQNGDINCRRHVGERLALQRWSAKKAKKTCDKEKPFGEDVSGSFGTPFFLPFNPECECKFDGQRTKMKEGVYGERGQREKCQILVSIFRVVHRYFIACLKWPLDQNNLPERRAGNWHYFSEQI